MSELPRVSYPGKRAWIGLLISGLIFLAMAAAVGLAVGAFTVAIWVVIHHYDPADWLKFSPFRKWLIGIPGDAWFATWLCGVAFLSAFGAAGSHLIYRPALSAPLALSVLLVVLVSPDIGDMLRLIIAGTTSPLSILVVPLAFYAPVASAALGGRFGARWFGVK